MMCFRGKEVEKFGTELFLFRKFVTRGKGQRGSKKIEKDRVGSWTENLIFMDVN